MTCKKAKEKRPGKMALIMKETTNKARNMALDDTFGTMVQLTKESGLTIRSRDKEAIRGQMVESIKVIGEKIKCMVMDVWSGLMVALMKENLKMT